MKPFSWELQGVVGSGKRSSKVNTLFSVEETHKTHIVTITITYTDQNLYVQAHTHRHRGKNGKGELHKERDFYTTKHFTEAYNVLLWLGQT